MKGGGRISFLQGGSPWKATHAPLDRATTMCIEASVRFKKNVWMKMGKGIWIGKELAEGDERWMWSNLELGIMYWIHIH